MYEYRHQRDRGESSACAVMRCRLIGPALAGCLTLGLAGCGDDPGCVVGVTLLVLPLAILSGGHLAPTSDPCRRSPPSPSAVPTNTQADPQYVRVAEEQRQRAEKGDADAQYNLGRAYQYGFGVAVNLAESAEWYGRAAGQGLPSAQHALALMYENGWGVSRDYVAADKWYTLAAKGGVSNGDELEKKMTSAQIAEAKKLVAEWKPTSAVAPTSPAASIPPSGNSAPPPNTSGTSHPRIGPV